MSDFSPEILAKEFLVGYKKLIEPFVNKMRFPDNQYHTSRGIYTKTGLSDEGEDRCLKSASWDDNSLRGGEARDPDDPDKSFSLLSEAQAIQRVDKITELFLSWDSQTRSTEPKIIRDHFKSNGAIDWSRINKIDLTEVTSGWRIGTQFNTNSCVGWTLATGVLDYFLAKKFQREKSGGRFYTPLGDNFGNHQYLDHFNGLLEFDKDQMLSPRYFWMVSKEYDGFVDLGGVMDDNCGTWLSTAFKVLREYKIAAKESKVPFILRSPLLHMHSNGDLVELQTSDSLKPFEAFTIYSSQMRGQIDSWSDSERISFEELILKWLVIFGPLGVEFIVDPNYAQIQDSESDAILYSRSDDESNRFNDFYHACSLVGIRKNKQGETFYKMKNSYGKSWGKDGTFEMSQKYFEDSVFTVLGISDLN